MSSLFTEFRARKSTQSKLQFSIWTPFGDQYGGGGPRGLALVNHTFLQHFVYLIFHFLTQFVGYPVLMFPDRPRVLQQNLMLNDVGSFEVVGLLIVEHVGVIS